MVRHEELPLLHGFCLEPKFRTQSQAILDRDTEIERCKRQKRQESTQMFMMTSPATSEMSSLQKLPDEDEVLMQVRASLYSMKF